MLQGGPGAEYFYCGPGFDVVVGFNAAEGDTNQTIVKMSYNIYSF